MTARADRDVQRETKEISISPDKVMERANQGSHIPHWDSKGKSRNTIVSCCAYLAIGGSGCFGGGSDVHVGRDALKLIEGEIL